MHKLGDSSERQPGGDDSQVSQEVFLRCPGRPRKPLPSVVEEVEEVEDSNDESRQKLGNEGDPEPGQEQWTSDGLREEYMKVVKDVQSCAEGDLSRRGTPKCRGVRIGERLLRAVDDLVVEEFERGKKTLWGLNCFVYAGAVVVTNRMQRPLKALRMQQVNPQKQADVARLHRTIGWLESEIRRIKQGAKATARQRTNMRRLKLEHSPLRELETSLETQKDRLRIRVTQLRRL